MQKNSEMTKQNMQKKLSKLLAILLAATIALSCGGENHVPKTKMSSLKINDYVTIALPQVKVDTLKGIDSRTFSISLANGLKVNLESSYYCNDLSEPQPELIQDSSYYKMMKINETHDDSVFGKTYILVRRGDIKDSDYYRKYKYRFGKLKNHEYKYISPSHTEKGLVGYHFYNLYTDQSMGKLKLNVTAYIENKSQEEEFIHLIEDGLEFR